MTALDVLYDEIGCENDEGYGCSCCPGRPEAIAALSSLQTLVAAVQGNVAQHVHNSWTPGHCDCRLCVALARVLDPTSPVSAPSPNSGYPQPGNPKHDAVTRPAPPNPRRDEGQLTEARET